MDAFVAQFFDGDMTRSNNKETLASDGEARFIITYFTVRCLDSVIRNRTRSLNDRMQAVTMMRYVYENKNYDNKKELVYLSNQNMKFFIKERLAMAIRMKNDSDHRCDQEDMEKLCGYAYTVLLSVHFNSEEATQYVNKLVQEYAHNQLGEDNSFLFSDYSPNKENNLLMKTLKERLPFLYQLSQMYQKSTEIYEKELKHITRIKLYGKRYLDGNEDLDFVDPNTD